MLRRLQGKSWSTLVADPRFFLPAGAAALLAPLILAVGPLRLLSRSAVIGLHTHDLFDHVWLHRGFLGSLFGDGSPLQTTAIAWPEGGSILHPDPAGALLFSLLAPLLGSVSAYNWMLLVQLWLAALAGWALCRRVTGSTLSGWFGGLLIGASPYLLGQVNTGETETVAVWPLILGLLYMERVTETRSWRDGILAGLFAGLGAVASWYHGAFLAFYLVGWLAVRARCPACIAVPALFAAVVAVPAAIYASLLGDAGNLFQGPAMATYLASHTEALAGMVADPKSLLGFFPATSTGAGHVRAQYLGTIVVAVALCGVVRGWRGSRWWLAVVACALVLALGPVLFLGGRLVSVEGDTVPLPYRLLSDHLPLFGLMRIPHRWTLLVAIGLAVLAARGVGQLARDRRAVVAVVVLAVGLHLCDLVLFSRVDAHSAVDITPPSLLSRLPGDGAVLDLPPRMAGSDARGRYLCWQPTHGRPIPYSLLMTGISPSLAAEPLVAAVASLDGRDQLVEANVEVAGTAEPDLESGNAAFRSAWAEREDGLGGTTTYALTVARLRSEGLDSTDVAGADRRLLAMGIDTVVLHADLLGPGDAAGQIRSLLVATLGEPHSLDADTLVWSLAGDL